ncbi:hypothetical protein [Mucilaginibacter paludis]|uniref:Coproporphyrinogen III oxidase n=1 Tax=Mucilaginibacter paludis DSM 18603 TaxID=714943 RepID=H1Y194_9SPHI|nr:hypothetical protein [Mucilaginibacter paludis]EHQ30228.1 hypothetical protein Mucpa_6170 [Mucilaginibacter paludis DSM 18603]
MKKKILSFALVTAMIGSIAVGCSSTKNAGGTDSTTVKDSGMSTTPAVTDTAKKDTTKTDTTKKM